MCKPLTQLASMNAFYSCGNWKHGSHQKNRFKKFQDFPGLSRTFFHFFQDFLHQSSNSNNKISFLQDKNIHLVVYINNSSFYSKPQINAFCNIYYILLYRSFTPWNWSLRLTFWLKDWKAESNYWTWFFSQYKWSKDVVHQICRAFFGTT